MWLYIFKRLLWMIPTLFIVILINFIIMRLAPGDPATLKLSGQGEIKGGSMDPKAFEIFKKQFHLDKPMLVNIRMFRDYSTTVEESIKNFGMNKKKLLEFSKGFIERYNCGDAEALSFEKRLEELDVKRIKERMDAYKKRSADNSPEAKDELQKIIESMASSVRIAFIMKMRDEVARWGIADLMQKLASETNTDRKQGILRCIGLTITETSPYLFESREDAETVAPRVAKWQRWFDSEKSKLKYEATRESELEKSFNEIATFYASQKDYADLKLQERVEEMILFDQKFTKDDCEFFMKKMSTLSNTKQRYICLRVLMVLVQKPFKNVKIFESEMKTVDDAYAIDFKDLSDADMKIVVENFEDYYKDNKDYFEPSFLKKLWMVATETQFVAFFSKLITFDFGISMGGTRKKVSELLWSAAKVSIPLMLIVESFIYIMAIPLGVTCAVNRGRATDRAISISLFILYSIPSFLAAIMAMAFVCAGGLWLQIFPSQANLSTLEGLPFLYMLSKYFYNMFLPIFCMSIFGLAGLAMYARTSMLEVLNQDYVRTARAKGVPEFLVVMKHAFRNGVIPLITLFASFLPALLGGSVIIETIFGVPGMGRLAFQSIENRDYTTLLSVLYIEAIITLASLLVVDILYVAVDPRISFEKLSTT